MLIPRIDAVLPQQASSPFVSGMPDEMEQSAIFPTVGKERRQETLISNAVTKVCEALQAAIRRPQRSKRRNGKVARNNVVVPEAKAALDKFKMEAAAEVGVNLKEGYNGELTSSISFIFEGDMEEPMACKWYANILIINIKDKKEACFNKKHQEQSLCPVN